MAASNGADADGGPDPAPSTTDDAGAASAAALTCLGVLQCAGACPDEDSDACVQSCLERTGESSVSVTTDFVQCLSDNSCADADCVRDKCKSELDACVADDATSVQGEPSTKPAPTGAVPTELVGLWSQVGPSGGSSYEFEADGATTQVFKSLTSYYCDTELDLMTSGVTVVSGDTLVYHRTEGTQVTKSCGSTTSKAVAPADLTYRYVLGTNEDGEPKLSLYFVDGDGAVASSPLELHH